MLSSIKSTDLKILIGASHPTTLESIHSYLAPAGYRIFSTLVKDGWTEFARMIEPDLILLDIETSDSSWLELCLELKSYKRCATLPLIIITPETNEQFLQLACEPGIIDIVRKPLNGIELLFRIRAFGMFSHLQKKLSGEPDFLAALHLAENIRHDMNQTLQSITGITELLLLKDLIKDPLTYDRVKKIHHEVEKFSRLVKGLGDLTCHLPESKVSDRKSKHFTLDLYPAAT
jgi:DNA-binding response OmpR family regulator